VNLPDLKPQGDQKDWARRLIAKHEAGERIRPISLRFAREALAEKNLLKEKK
jgi:hypothetical protein